MNADQRIIVARMTANLGAFIRGFEALADASRLANHRIVTEFGRQWEYPEAVLTDEEIDSIAARQMGRTLAAIDDLPTRDD